jgi:hypothetical protein
MSNLKQEEVRMVKKIKVAKGKTKKPKPNPYKDGIPMVGAKMPDRMRATYEKLTVNQK